MSDLFRRLFGRAGNTPPRDVAALAAPLMAPAVQVIASGAVSMSHLGGVPRLPNGNVWPERNGNRLGFLARLSLPEIHRAHPIPWLPETGALLFFYDLEEQPWGFDPKDRGGAAVVLVPDLPAAVEQAAPDPNSVVSIPHSNVDFRRIHVLPSMERAPVQALALANRESDEYSNLMEKPHEGMPKHQVSGFPVAVQNDSMELECQLVSNGIYCGDPSGYEDPRVRDLEPGAANWRLLLQLDTDEDRGIMWGDCGTIYFWVEEQAARAGNFANVWLILQCH